MSQETLLAAAAFAFIAAGLYTYVGAMLARRRVSGEAQLAATLFAVWWLGLAATTAIGGVLDILGAFSLASLPTVLTLTMFNLLVVCVALWGLLFYLVYLFTGRRGVLLPLSAFYVAYYALLVYFIVSGNPVGVEIRRWNVALDYAIDLSANPLWTPVLLLLLVPQIAGALAYFTLYFRVKDRTSRYRVALVSWSIIIWFTTVLVAAGTGLSTADDYQLASRFLGLGAALAILFAYRPPGPIRRRLGVTSVSDEVNASA